MLTHLRSGIFKAKDPRRMAEAIVQATTHFRDAERLAKVSEGLGEAMKGIDFYGSKDAKFEMFSTREKY